MNGYIKLHRQIIEWEWYTDPNVMRLFIHCLLSANRQTQKWQGITIDKGSFITSYDKLAHSLNLSVQQIRTAINKLKSTNEITNKTTRHYSIITVNNWDCYQDNNKQDNIQITNNQQTNNKQITINKNIEKDKKDKKYISISQSDKKTDPYFSSYKLNFENEYKKVFGKKPYLQRKDCFKIIELTEDFEDFNLILPEALRKLYHLSFDDIDFKPTASWLLTDSNFAKLMNGSFDKNVTEIKRKSIAEILAEREQKNG